MTQLVLKTLGDHHVGELFSLWSDPATIRWTNWGLVASLDEVLSRIARIKVRYSGCVDRAGPYVVRTPDGAFVGLSGVDFVDEEHELWYLLHREQWGKGYGTTAVAEVLSQLQRERRFWKIVATAVTTNTASWRLLERNGFARIKVVSSAFDRNGVEADLYKYERHLLHPA